MSDTELLDFLEQNRQYVIGFAPSGDWSAFTVDGETCYGKTIRDCLNELLVMHENLKKGLAP